MVTNLRIEVVQLSGRQYFWVLACDEKILASSSQIAVKLVIEKEAELVAEKLKLVVIVCERS